MAQNAEGKSGNYSGELQVKYISKAQVLDKKNSIKALDDGNLLMEAGGKELLLHTSYKAAIQTCSSGKESNGESVHVVYYNDGKFDTDQENHLKLGGKTYKLQVDRGAVPENKERTLQVEDGKIVE